MCRDTTSVRCVQSAGSMTLPTTRGQQPSKSGALAAALAVTGVAIALSIGLSFAALLLTHALDIRLSLTARVAVTILVIQVLAFSGTAVFALRRGGERLSSVGWRAPNRRDVVACVGGYVLAVFGVIIVASLAQSLGVRFAANEIGVLARANPELIPMLIVLALIVIGPAEELLFRGVVQRRLQTAFRTRTAVALAAALFAGVHALALVDSWDARLATIAVLFVPSLVFGAIYARTSNLVVPALVHGAYDATLLAVLYLVVSN